MGNEELSVEEEIVMWALGKLHDELMFYEEYDIRHGTERNSATLNQINAVAKVRNDFLNGNLTITKKENANA